MKFHYKNGGQTSVYQELRICRQWRGRALGSNGNFCNRETQEFFVVVEMLCIISGLVG